MNDRLKFRGWDNFEKKMISWDECLNNESLIAEFLLNAVRYKAMQCTGLKDKNGRLIYEGDILKGANGSVNGSLCEFTGVVKWSKQKARFDLPVWAYDNDGNYSDDLSHFFEVIGNIHETPDLLIEKSEKPIF